MKVTRQTTFLVFVALQALGALALIASFYVQLWPLELLVSFTPALLVVLAISLASGTVIALSVKSLRQSKALAATISSTWLIAFVLLFCSFNTHQPITLAPSDEPAITFATFNKLYSNNEKAAYTDYLRQQSIDIIALQEVRADEVAHIAEQLNFEHTYTSRAFTAAGGTSVALVSRWPFTSVETVELATGHPVVRAVVQTPSSGDVVVYSVHTPVPTSNFLYTKRNIILGSFAQVVQQETLPVIVGGDFNTTVFSPTLRTFTSATSSVVRPVIAKKLPVCSWHGYGAPLCVRIDHIYAPTGAQITDLTISPDLGSDHRAVIVRIQP